MDSTSAAGVNSIVFVTSAVASPFFGACIDAVGCNLVWVAVGVLMTAGVHICFAFTTVTPSPFLLMIVLGLSYSILASSLWPMIGLVVPQHKRGTAYGLVQSVQNLGLGLISLLTGLIVDCKVLLSFLATCLRMT